MPFGSDDFFCGGQIITPEGVVVVFGGTDIEANCYSGQPFNKGHHKVWIFDNRTAIDLNTTPWTLPQWFDGGDDMLRSRWYASSVVAFDGRILVAAHAGPDVPPQSPHSSRVREYGRLGLGATPTFDWDPPPAGQLFWRNWRYSGIGFSPCDKYGVEGEGDMAVYSYEHLRQLTDRRILGVVGRRNANVPYPLHQTFFLDLDVCPFDPTDTERWVPGPGTPALLPMREGAPSVHVIDDTFNPPHEVIYSIGGGDGETECPTTATDQVVKMILPAASPGLEAWELAPTLGRQRNSCNAALGLDGSIIVVGGLKRVTPPSPGVPYCSPVLKAERLRPPELFKTGDTLAWHDLCPQAHQRSYHSTLLLMQDGRLVSAGGTDPTCEPVCSPPMPFIHSVETYSPPYLFQGEQPVILNPVLATGMISAPLVGGDFVSLDVLLPGTVDPASEFRVALVRPGAVTHANDTGSRYIKLSINGISLDPVDPSLATIEVRIPSFPEIAPAGHYMITVVSSDGVPSAAKWLRIVP